MSKANQAGQSENTVEQNEAENIAQDEISVSAPDVEFTAEIKDPADILQERVQELENELAAMKDRSLRALADAENTRRRALKDVEDARAFGGTKLANDLLPVLDNLDRALNAATDDMRAQAKDFFEGVELTRRELLNAFSKHKIEMITPQKGDKFDPNLHQAMFEAPVPNTENGTIIEVMQVGFTISGRLLRPAFVGVAKSS
jgi:molecular chaperone GrpE